MVDVARDQLKMKVKIDASWLLHVLSSRGLMLSGAAAAVFTSSLVRARLVSCSVTTKGGSWLSHGSGTGVEPPTSNKSRRSSTPEVHRPEQTELEKTGDEDPRSCRGVTAGRLRCGRP
ncbi:hypothetical protein ElyMa_004547500 [Elysia marginata]|uniref:Uncharacterized protein n=1 Tax=Elysia marginata TaxID=1093978 RepID=A0AAV4HQX1_9GAST|nr:hypothetical protein ElyMa_004547500 [Elysia marginata]